MSRRKQEDPEDTVTAGDEPVAEEAPEFVAEPVIIIEDVGPVTHPEGDDRARRITYADASYEHVSEQQYNGRERWVYRRM
jgi:hypothetical protein